MTSTEALRLIVIFISLSILTYLIFIAIEIKRLRYIALFLITLVTNIFARFATVLLFTPLTANEIIVFNNWSLVIILQTLIMMASLMIYLVKKETL